MTQMLIPTEVAMELDIDSFLDSPLSSDSDDESNFVPHRTIDEILNQSDSSPSPSPPSSSVRPPLQLGAVEQEPTNTVRQPQPDSKSEGFARAADPIWRIQSSSSSTAPRQLPTLFGGLRSKAKPGAALAAASASSRSAPTPHAAALKSRRTGSGVLRSGVQGGEIGSGFGGENSELRSSNGDSIGVSFARSDSVDKLDDDFNRYHSVEHEVRLGRQSENGRDEIVHDRGKESHWRESERIDGNSVSSDESLLIKTTLLANLNMEQVNGSTDLDSKQAVNDIAAVSQLAEEVRDNEITALSVDWHSTFSNVNDVDKKNANWVDQWINLEEEVTNLDLEDEKDMQTTSDVEQVGENDDDASSASEISELVEERIEQSESERMNKKAENYIQAPKKPLELAEELEKKMASTGLHLAEGAAAQPMRLEGVRRGSTTLGYFDVDAHNIVTGTISSQAFRRDHGSPQALAVHSNFIAVGMSKGTIALVPSKYSPQHADNMDSKVLMLGVQGDRSLSPVTSMCFNQQGDLLLAGYADGHITVWDVQRTSIAKSIAGEHSAPVVHTFFLGHDSQATRQFKAVTGDNKGLVQLHTFSVFPLLNRFTIKTQCLLDGQRTSTVLSASPLLFDDPSGANVSVQGNSVVSMTEEGVVVFVTHQNALVVRLSPNLEVYSQLPRPEGVREGSMPYTAWKCVTYSCDSSENTLIETTDRISLLLLAWDRNVQVVKLVKSELKLCAKWSLDSSAVGVTWLDDQMLVVLTVTGQLYLFMRDGTLIHQTSFVVDGFGGDDLIAYNTHFVNIFGNPEKSYHNCIAARGASVYILGPMHLAISRLLPWKERIQVMQKAGDWMGALSMAMTLYDGRAPRVIGLSRNPDAVRDVIMPYLVELLLSYVDEVFSYISVAFCNQKRLGNETSRTDSLQTEIKEQFTRVGGVAVEFCVHIKRTDILFDEIFSRFVAVQHRDTFLELLEPYVLKDMLGSLPPEIMQALVEHYSSRGWLQRVEQCVLHMDISSLDFNQVARLCREHGLYSALIYIFNKGLDDFRAPLEELLAVLRNCGGETAHALGYRMLVYLKYCFLGLAFPPGQGSLPTSRLPSLRAELLQFLLEVSDRRNAKPTAILSFGGQYFNLYYLLELDTEATLDVLRWAFAEADAPKLVCPLPDSSDTSGKPAKQSDLVTVSQNMLTQNTVDALVHIVEDVSHIDGSVVRAENKLLEVWPSPKDIAHLLEFIAYYVSCGKANISKTVLNQILQYLTSERDPAQNMTTSETPKTKEKKLLALLSVVPGTEWDQIYVLQMCSSAQFFQICGFIHAIRQQHVAALDSYIKEIDEPVHAFSFINDSLLRLTGDEAAAFRSAVLSRIPKLVNLSREGTFLLVLDHFNPESQLILAELQGHPKSLFLYLKTAIEVHLSGTLNLSDLSVNEPAYASSGRKLKDQSTVIEAYLGRFSEWPKLLHSNPLTVTDDMIESYLELLCQFERDSVLKFLETFDSYRVEHCLRLCQEYGITDAAAFLMERVGDVGSALLLTLAELDDKFMKLDTAVSNAVSHASLKKSASMDHLNTVMKMKEVNDIYGVLHACIGLCRRNTPRLNPEESDVLWFRLLDSFCEPMIGSYLDDARASNVKGHVGSQVKLLDPKDGKEMSPVHWKISKSHGAAHILRKLFSQFIKEIVEGMIGYVHLPTIMSKLLSDNGSQEFGDFKLTILGMLGTYGFERRILDTAKSLIEDDTFYTMSLLRKGASHGYAPRSLVCCICSSSLTKNSSGFRVRVFNCGHATHLQCEILENESSIRGASSGCPICLPKKNMQRARNKSVQTENGLVSTLASKDPRAQGSLHPHESDVLDISYGVQQISRFEILSNLQKGQRLAQTESMPQLRLAPPAIYHEKVKKGMDLLVGGSSSQLTTAAENPRKSGRLRDLRVKGSVLRFPIKSSIFGKEKTSGG